MGPASWFQIALDENLFPICIELDSALVVHMISMGVNFMSALSSFPDVFETIVVGPTKQLTSPIYHLQSQTMQTIFPQDFPNLEIL